MDLAMETPRTDEKNVMRSDIALYLCHANQVTARGTDHPSTTHPVSFQARSKVIRINSYYGEYSRGRFRCLV